MAGMEATAGGLDQEEHFTQSREYNKRKHEIAVSSAPGELQKLDENARSFIK